MRQFNWFIVFITAVSYSCMVGCDNDVLEPKEYVMFLTNVDNGFRKTSMVNQITYDIQYCTPEYKAIMETRVNITEESFKRELERFSDGLHFTFRINDNSLDKYEDPDDGKLEINYSSEIFSVLNFAMEPRFVLMVNKDTLVCKLSHLEPLVTERGMFNYSLIFDQSEKYLQSYLDDTLKFVFYDGIWNSDSITFDFAINNLINRNEIKF